MTGKRQLSLVLFRRAAALLLFLLLTFSVGASKEPSAEKLYKTGRKYEKRKDYANAYLFYSKAAAKKPADKKYWLRAQALQRRAVESAGVMPVSAAAGESTGSPDTPLVPPDQDDLREARKPQPPMELKSAPVQRDLDFRADHKQVWEEVTKSYGLKVIFDGDYDAGAAVAIRMTGADYRTALHALSVTTSSFFVPISEDLLLVVKDTEAKRREVENNVAISIPIPDPVSLQEAQELGRSVQQLMEIQKLSIDSVHRVVVMRDRVSKVRPAQLVLQQLLHTRPEIALEVQFFATGRSRSRTIGTNLQTSTTLTPFVSAITLAGGPISFGLAIRGANVVAASTDSYTRLLFQAELRSLSGEKSSILVGQKYPIQTLGYIGEVPAGETAYTPPPSFNFEDLGFNLKITPRVHDRQEVSLDIDTEFKLLGAGSLNGIPVISNRKFTTQARLRFNEAAVISGLVSQTDVRSLVGPAGLLSVPGLAALLGSDGRTVDDAEVLLVITPRLLSPPTSEFLTRDIWIGSESRPRIPM
ncbi:MAG: type II and III secretion system protein [Bryobacteraceae bacterium]|nr:type II and III secretion system protein [Bryobacteraceae bacterium]